MFIIWCNSVYVDSCSQGVVRIEQAALGTVFVCTYGGTKHGVSGCHRTYLSQRDLQAHAAHRHFGAGREPPPQRVVPPELLPAPGVARPPGPGGPVLAYSVSQPVPAMIGDGSNLVFRPHQPTPPSGPTMPPIAASRPPPGIPQAPLPPSQHILAQRGPQVISTNPPPNLPPRMLSTSHASGLPPPLSVSGMANPPAMLVQTMPVGAPTAVRPTNLITVKLTEDGDFRHSADSQGSAGRPPFTSQPPPSHDAPLPQFSQQHFPPRGPPPSFSQTQDHHQMAVRPLMTHPGALPPQSSPMSRPPGLVGMPPPGQMGLPSAPPQRLAPPPQNIHSVPPQNLGPPPQAIHSGLPQGIHSAPPPGMHTGPPPQGLHSGPPPPQSLRTGPHPGFPPPARHPSDQHVQLQQMPWPSGGQVQRIAAPPGSRPSPGPSQSMPFYP